MIISIDPNIVYIEKKYHLLIYRSLHTRIMSTYVYKKTAVDMIEFYICTMNTSMGSTRAGIICDLLYVIPMAVVKPMHVRVTYRFNKTLQLNIELH